MPLDRQPSRSVSIYSDNKKVSSLGRRRNRQLHAAKREREKREREREREREGFGPIYYYVHSLYIACSSLSVGPAQ